MGGESTLWMAIEGPCCAGKTTLGDALLERLGPGETTIIPDYADFVGGAAGMPDPDPACWPDERAAIDVLLDVENQRFRDHLPRQPPRQVLIDRSVLTLEAHCAGLDRRHPSRPPFAGRAAVMLAEDTRPGWPQATLYLDIPHEPQLARNDSGKFAPESIFMDPDYNVGFREWFRQEQERGERPLAWISADAPPEAVLEQALAFLARLGRETRSESP